jgi:hypothetical protein
VILDGVRPSETFGTGTNPLNNEPVSSFFPDFRSDILPKGALFSSAFGTGVPVTGPAHCSLLTSSHLPFGHYPVGPTIGDYVPELPTLFHALHHARPKAKALYVSNSEFVHPMIETLYPSENFEVAWNKVMENGDETTDDGLVLSETLRLMQESQPDLVAVNLHHVDNAGHNTKEPANYLDAAPKIDTPLTEFWASLQKLDYYKNTTIMVVSSDHGRHTEDYTDHGDSCLGCRQIPLFLVGPGIKAGTFENPAELTDIAPTLAAAMKLELPYAEGMVLDEILEESVVSRSGTREVAGNAEVRYGRDRALRRSLFWEDTQVSSPQAFDAGGMVEAGDLLCFREQLWGEAAPGAWEERCRFSDGTELEFPINEIPPYFLPGLVWQDSTLYSFFELNPEGRVTQDPDPMPLKLARYQNGGWEMPEIPLATYFPQWPLVGSVAPERLIIAYSGSDDGLSGRLYRQLHVHTVDWPASGNPRISAATTFETPERQERPALFVNGSAVKLAFLNASLEKVSVILVESEDGGLSWGSPQVISGEAVLPHIPPVFTEDGDLYWVERGDEAMLCELGGCEGLGAEELGSLSVRGGRVVVTRLVEEWEVFP